MTRFHTIISFAFNSHCATANVFGRTGRATGRVWVDPGAPWWVGRRDLGPPLVTRDVYPITAAASSVASLIMQSSVSRAVAHVRPGILASGVASRGRKEG